VKAPISPRLILLGSGSLSSKGFVARKQGLSGCKYLAVFQQNRQRRYTSIHVMIPYEYMATTKKHLAYLRQSIEKNTSYYDDGQQTHTQNEHHPIKQMPTWRTKWQYIAKELHQFPA